MKEIEFICVNGLMAQNYQKKKGNYEKSFLTDTDENFAKRHSGVIRAPSHQ
jgi:hypothetical protein